MSVPHREPHDSRPTRARNRTWSTRLPELGRGGPMLVALLVGGVAVSVAPDARADDPFWGRDKALHFGVSVLLSSGAYAASSLVLERPWQRALAGGVFSLAVGAAKEAYDATGHGTPSWRDFAWDGAGTLVGVGICFTIDTTLLAPAPAR